MCSGVLAVSMRKYVYAVLLLAHAVPWLPTSGVEHEWKHRDPVIPLEGSAQLAFAWIKNKGEMDEVTEESEFLKGLLCTATDYKAANHAPSVRVTEGIDITAGADDKVTLTAVGEDPDGDAFTYRRQRYFEADTHDDGVAAHKLKHYQRVVVTVAQRLW